MKTIRRILLVITFVVSLIFVVLLLNFTAPNPTGRRYSSNIPLTTGQGTANQIGFAAELILANDLHLPRNDQPDQRQCICNNAANQGNGQCNICLISVPISSPFRVPDFVSPNFLAESKNARNLYIDSRDFDQISDFAAAAQALKRPLWVYTRVNTDIDPKFVEVVNATGGGVVQYFRTPGYIDSVDQAANGIVIPSGIVFLLCGGWEWLSQRKPRLQVQINDPTPTDPVGKTVDSLDNAAAFVRKNKDDAKNRLDT